MNDLGSTPPLRGRTEVLTPPQITELATLTDGRPPGRYQTIYPCSAWIQIAIEFLYLVIFEIVCLYFLFILALYATHDSPSNFFYEILGPHKANERIVAFTSIALSGACGGSTFALKWLYHTVAKMQWHRDRIVWRIVVPVSSGFLALFSGLMVISGLVPFLSKTPLMVPATGAAYGFFVGLFSDNVLAALQRLAFNLFGTVDDKGKANPLSSTDSS